MPLRVRFVTYYEFGHGLSCNKAFTMIQKGVVLNSQRVVSTDWLAG